MNCFIHPAGLPINTSTIKVLRRPVESAQYTSTQIHDVAMDLGVRVSVGRTGVCWDNAQQESFWSTLKTEFYDRYSWPRKDIAIQAVGTWIETVYNRRRWHSALNMTSPVGFENAFTSTAAQAA